MKSQHTDPKCHVFFALFLTLLCELYINEIVAADNLGCKSCSVKDDRFSNKNRYKFAS